MQVTRESQVMPVATVYVPLIVLEKESRYSRHYEIPQILASSLSSLANSISINKLTDHNFAQEIERFKMSVVDVIYDRAQITKHRCLPVGLTLLEGTTLVKNHHYAISEHLYVVQAQLNGEAVKSEISQLSLFFQDVVKSQNPNKCLLQYEHAQNHLNDTESCLIKESLDKGKLKICWLWNITDLLLDHENPVVISTNLFNMYNYYSNGVNRSCRPADYIQILSDKLNSHYEYAIKYMAPDELEKSLCYRSKISSIFKEKVHPELFFQSTKHFIRLLLKSQSNINHPLFQLPEELRLEILKNLLTITEQELLSEFDSFDYSKNDEEGLLGFSQMVLKKQIQEMNNEIKGPMRDRFGQSDCEDAVNQELKSHVGRRTCKEEDDSECTLF